MNTLFQRMRFANCDRYGYPDGTFRWGPWTSLEHPTDDRVEARLAFWRSLNDYAVSCRGPSAKREFKVEPGYTFTDDNGVPLPPDTDTRG